MSNLQSLINTWIFDLDNTLYSADSGIFQQVHNLMGKYVSSYLNIDIDTYSNEHLFFSHRRSSHLFTSPTGRLINMVGFRNII